MTVGMRVNLVIIVMILVMVIQLRYDRFKMVMSVVMLVLMLMLMSLMLLGLRVVRSWHFMMRLSLVSFGVLRPLKLRLLLFL